MRTRQLVESTGMSQPTISRAISSMGDEIVRIGSGPSIQYAIRDGSRGIDDVPVYQVDVEGRLRLLGQLIAVQPEGYIMRQEDGVRLHYEGLPWWLYDMRPQGFLGRAYAHRHADELGLPSNPQEWSDTHALRALLRHGEDSVGNLLLGDRSRERFLSQPAQTPVDDAVRGETYVRLADEATRGELPESSAGGEQPKFVTYAMMPDGPRHILVKFSVAEENSVAERWRDLLLAEHIAAETLLAAGVEAVTTRLFDYGGQRFLEIERFDRVGDMGRHAVVSLAAQDAEFVGMGAGAWPEAVRRLSAEGHVQDQAYSGASILHAFGTLIGNTDMHFGNLSFLSDHGRPYELAPAYDMLPMGFSPRRSGELPDALPEASIVSSVDNKLWAKALEVARDYLSKLQAARDDGDFSERFWPCIIALERHISTAASKITRLA
jgi:hypothetical protein